MRHWRRDYVTVAPPSTQESITLQNDIWAVELPHGMPKDSHLLPQHSQDLLRAARSGKIYKRPPPVEEEEADPEVVAGDKPEKKDDDPRDRGFTAKAWKQIPRQMEGPDIEYLAKRRKGLVTVSPKAVTRGPTLTKTTIRRIDAAGNEYVSDVIAPKGQPVEGEVIAQTVIPAPAAAEGSTVPTPPKRKGPPPKKKLKGPGRGRKKKQIAPTSVPENVQADGLTQGVEGGAEGAAGPDVSVYRGIFKLDTDSLQGVKFETTGDENGVAAPTPNEDTEMAEGSIAATDDEGGEDGEEGDEDDDDEGSINAAPESPSKPPPPLSPVASELPKFGSIDTDMSGIDIPGPSLPRLETSEGTSGSPLKNVALTTSSLTSPISSPEATKDPFTEPVAPQEPVEEAGNINIPEAADPTTLDEDMQQQAPETAPPTLPLPPPNPTLAEVISSTEVRREEEEEEEMLLDTLENARNATIGASQDAIPSAPEIPTEPAPLLPQEPEAPISEPEPAQEAELVPQAEEEKLPTPPIQAPASEELAPQPQPVEDDEDDDEFNDLLGGLEKRLNESQAAPASETEAAPESVQAQVEAEPESAVEEGAEVAEVLEPLVGEEKGEDVQETTEGV